MSQSAHCRHDITTKTARIYLADQGFVRVDVKIDARQNLEHAIENMAAAIEVCGGKKRPILTDIRKAMPMEPDARRYYSGHMLVENFLAMAILVDVSPVGRMMANVFLRISNPEIPAKMFINEAASVSWLSEHTQ